MTCRMSMSRSPAISAPLRTSACRAANECGDVSCATGTVLLTHFTRAANRAASLVALTFSLQYEIMTRKTEGFPGGGQGSAAMWRGAVGNLYGFQVWRKPDRGFLNRRFKSRAGATIAKLTEQAKRSETTGSSPVATTRAEPNRKVRLVAYSFS